MAAREGERAWNRHVKGILHAQGIIDGKRVRVFPRGYAMLTAVFIYIGANAKLQ